MQLVIILLIKVVFLIAVENNPVSKKHVTCPCISHYSGPNYNCLFEKLKNNETLSPFCLNLTKEMDIGHKFGITRHRPFKCNKENVVYLYKCLDGFCPTSTSGGTGKLLLQQETCQSIFGNADVFKITARSRKFYELISRSMAIINHGGIECRLAILSLWDENHSCLKAIPKWSYLISDSFLYNDGTFYSAGDPVIIDVNHEFNAGFLYPNNISSQVISPGSVVINPRKLLYKYMGHCMSFTCEWGKGSLYYGRTRVISKAKYKDLACVVDVTEPKGEMVEAVRIKLNLAFQRVFKNSIAIKLLLDDAFITKEHKDLLHKDEIICRFFSGAGENYILPRTCVSCVIDRKNCSDCWDKGFFDSPLSSVLKFRSSHFVLWEYLQMQTLILRINHQNIMFNGSLPVQHFTQNQWPHFFDIFQHDYIYGNISSYTTGFYPDIMSKAVLIPGNQNVPTDLSVEDVKSLWAVCRGRVVLNDNSTGKWSNPVRIHFQSTDAFSHGINTIMLQDDKGDRTYLLIRREQNNLNIRRFSKPKNPHNDLVIFAGLTCINKVFRRKYVFQYPSMQNNASLMLNTIQEDYAGGQPGNIVPSPIYASSTPFNFKCAILHPFILWTEKVEEKKYRIILVKLEKESGRPLTGKIELSAQNVCECSKENSITSPAIDIVYTNLSNPETVEIAAVCGSSICMYELTTGRSSKKKIFFDLNDYTAGSGNFVRNIILEQNYVFLTIEYNNTYLYIVPVNPINIAEKNFKTFRFYDEIVQVEMDTVISLPVPSKHCMDPHINYDQTTAIMSNSSIISIEVAIFWDDGPECDQFAKPPTMIDISYAKITTHLMINKEINCKSYEYQNLLSCKRLPTSLFHGTGPFQAVISEVLINEYYQIDVTVRAGIDDETYGMWYTGSIAADQFFSTVVHTWYSTNSGYHWVGAVAGAGVIVLLMVFLISGIFYWSYTRKMYMYKHLNRISARNIKKEKKLGEGNFGEVWKASLENRSIVVKMLKESATDREEKEFREEALLLSKLNSDNIVRAVGICLQSRPIMLCLEFLNGGSLDVYLKQDEVRSSLKSDDLFQITVQTLKGCAYLEQQGYIHRDIASRNCLLSTISDSNLKPKCVKLSDFGLAKDVGVESAYRSRDPDADTLPIAWTAPEAFSGKFSPKSDVWAFGVLIWEIFSWAATPYGQCSDTSGRHICKIKPLSHDEIEFQVCVQKKSLLNFPDPCTAAFCSALKNVMAVCWQFAAEERPSFKQLQKYFNGAKEEISKTYVGLCFTKFKAQQKNQKDSDQCSKGNNSESEGRHLMQTAYSDPDTNWKQRFVSHYHGMPCIDEKTEDMELLPLVKRDVAV